MFTGRSAPIPHPTHVLALTLHLRGLSTVLNGHSSDLLQDFHFEPLLAVVASFAQISPKWWRIKKKKKYTFYFVPLKTAEDSGFYLIFILNFGGFFYFKISFHTNYQFSIFPVEGAAFPIQNFVVLVFFQVLLTWWSVSMAGWMDESRRMEGMVSKKHSNTQRRFVTDWWDVNTEELQRNCQRAAEEPLRNCRELLRNCQRTAENYRITAEKC